MKATDLAFSYRECMPQARRVVYQMVELWLTKLSFHPYPTYYWLKRVTIVFNVPNDPQMGSPATCSHQIQPVRLLEHIAYSGVGLYSSAGVLKNKWRGHIDYRGQNIVSEMNWNDLIALFTVNTMVSLWWRHLNHCRSGGHFPRQHITNFDRLYTCYYQS